MAGFAFQISEASGNPVGRSRSRAGLYRLSIVSQRLKSLLQQEPIGVTGLGVFSAAGGTKTEFFNTLLQGRSPAVFASMDNRRIPLCCAPEADLNLAGLRKFSKHDRAVQMALIAAQQSWEESQLASKPVPPDRIAVLVGTSRSVIGKTIAAATIQNSSQILPSLAPHSTIAALSGALGQYFETRGPALTISATCASTGHAIALAAQQILLGVVDVALVGGSEAPILPSLVLQMHAAGVLGSHESAGLACRPFSACRNGTIIGEGAGFLVLESLRSARRRGVEVLAQLTGWSTGSDITQRTSISQDAESTRLNLMSALELADLRPHQIGYVHTHGTGTIMNDLAEARALHQIFGDKVACSSTKAVTGHCMGASAALASVTAILAMNSGWLPPSANCLSPDPDCKLDLIRNAPRKVRPDAVVTNSSGFWGTSSVLVFSREKQ